MNFGVHKIKEPTVALTAENWRDRPVGCDQHFFDSGSFTIWTKSQEYARVNGTDEWAYYHTPEFFEYMDAYAKFVQKYKLVIDFCANVDAIPNPDLTWRNQQYLESKGIKPVPVVHFGTHLKWLKHYMENGYDFIALGGMVKANEHDRRRWLDRAFTMVCDGPGNLPTVKIHGFGMFVPSVLFRYPWWSIDSSAWDQHGAYGRINVPRKRKGKYDFSIEPVVTPVAVDGNDRKKLKHHFLNMPKTAQKQVTDWLDYIGVPLGKIGPDGKAIEYGVMTYHMYRRHANVLYFEALRKQIPTWPWPFRVEKKPTFGLLK